MQQLLLVNPRKRTARRKSTKAASPAQKRARAAFAAAARARSNPAKRRRVSAKKRTTRRASPTVTIMANPRKRRSRKSAARTVRHTRRRRNPGHSLMSKPMSILTPALIGALGATAVNTILNQISGSLPASLTTGNMSYATRAAAAIGLGMIAGKLGMRGAMVRQMAEGSLTVTLHDAITSLAGQAGMPLSGMGVYMPAVNAQRPGRYARPAQSMQGLRSVGNANGGGMNVNGINAMGKYVSGPGAMTSNVQALRGANGGFTF